MKIWITGAAGQLGYEIKNQITDDGNVYAFTTRNEVNVCCRNEVMHFVDEFKPDILVNCAAYTAVDLAEEEVDKCKQINADAPALLAEIMAQHGGALLHISTDYVFDGKTYIPYNETAQTNPQSNYGCTKLMGEQLAVENNSQCMIIRTSWLYSAYGHNFVKTMLKLGHERRQIGVVFDQMGSPTYAKDLATLILMILHKGITPGIFHFSNEGVCSWYDFAKTIMKLKHIQTCKVLPLHTKEYPTKAVRPAFSVLDKTKIKQTYGIEIRHWMDALEDCLQNI